MLSCASSLGDARRQWINLQGSGGSHDKRDQFLVRRGRLRGGLLLLLLLLLLRHVGASRNKEDAYIYCVSTRLFFSELLFVV